MWNAVQPYWRSFLNWCNGLGDNQWLVILAVVMVVGFICMQGVAGKKNY